MLRDRRPPSDFHERSVHRRPRIPQQPGDVFTRISLRYRGSADRLLNRTIVMSGDFGFLLGRAFIQWQGNSDMSGDDGILKAGF
jgi:hypothetical protein